MKKIILSIIIFLITNQILISNPAEAERNFSSGRAAFNNKLYSLAINFFRKTISADPKGQLADDAAYYIALCFYYDEKYENAIQSFIKFNNDYPNSPYRERAFFMIAQSYFNLKKYDSAIQNFNNFLKSYPDSQLRDNAHYLIGFSHLYMSRFESAIESFKIIVNTMTNSQLYEDAMLRLSQSLVYAKYYDEADKTIRRFIDIFKNSNNLNEALYIAGRANYFLEKFSDAKNFFLRIKNINDFEYKLDVFYFLSLIFIKESNYTEAEKYLYNLSEIKSFKDSQNEYRLEALYKLGLIYKLKEEYRKAAETFEKIIKEYPNSEYYFNSLNEAANCRILIEDYNGAINIYQAIKRLGGENIALGELKIGEMNFWQKKYNEAHTNFDFVIRNYSNTMYYNSAIYWKGRTFYEQNNFKNAVDYFLNYVKLDPLSENIDEIYLFIGNCYVKDERYDDALVAYNSAIKNSKSTKYHDDAYNAIAWTYIKKGEYARAEEHYNELIKKFPSSPLIPAAYYGIGIVKYNLKDYNSAKENFDRVVKNYPNTEYAGDSMIKLGWILYKLEKFKELNNYLRSIKIDNLNKNQQAEIYNLNGWALFRLENYKEAIELFQRSLNISIDKQQILDNILYIAKSYYNLENYEKAIVYYNEYISKAESFNLKNDLPAVLSDMGWLFVKLGESGKANYYYNKLINEFKDSIYTSEALFKLAEYYYNEGNFLKAIDYYNKIIEITKDNLQNTFRNLALYWISWCYINLNDKIKAIEYFENYTKEYPKGDYIIDTYYRLSRLYYDLNNIQKAKEYNQILIKLFPSSIEASKAKVALAELEIKERSGGNEEKMYLILIDEAKDDHSKASAMYKLAKYYQKMDRKEEALQYFNKIVNISTEEEAGLASYEIALDLIDKGKYEDAINILSSIFYVYKTSSIYPESLYYIAYSYIKLNNVALAKRFIDRLGSNYPDSEWNTKAKELLKNIDK